MSIYQKFLDFLPPLIFFLCFVLFLVGCGKLASLANDIDIPQGVMIKGAEKCPE